ncbi:MAG: histone deacetylase [Epsilonproteobacteria bacterium]|nr:histone deacetylase [Campylobacterota bacterium]
MVGYLYDPIFTLHETGNHIENKNRVMFINDMIRSDFSYYPIEVSSYDKRDLYRIHDDSYVDWVEEGYENGVRMILNSDTILSPKSYEVALTAATCTKNVIDLFKRKEINTAFLNLRPPGHHAERMMGQGFCIFNNVAMMAKYAQDAGYKKVMIIDFDVHHGNGTQDIFYKDDTVFYFSTHERNNYPYFTGSEEERGEGRGLGFNLNKPYEDNIEDEEFLALYEDLPKDFDFDIVLVSAGYDLMKDEAISSANITFAGLERLVRKIVDFSKDKPLAFLLEGGYNLDSLVKSAEITFGVLSER